jgi:capsular exopolysaccharide synthesis family protein
MRYGWVVAAVTVAGTAIGFGVSRFLPPKYTAEATVWVEVDRSRGTADRGPIRQDPMLGAAAWTDLLKSFVVLDEVTRETRRYLEVESKADAPAFADFRIKDRFRPGAYHLNVGNDGNSFTLETDRGVEVQHGAIGDSIGNALGFEWLPPPATLRPGRSIAFQVITPRDAALHLAGTLHVAADREGNFLRLQLEGTDAEESAMTLNALARRYVDVAADLKRKKLSELTRILSDQLAVAQTNLKKSESDLQGFRVRTITLPADKSGPVAPGLEMTQAPVLQSFFQLKIEREQLRRDREAIENALASPADSMSSPTGLALIGSVRSSPELTRALEELNTKQADLRALLYRYTPQTPAVQRIQGDVQTLQTQTIPRLARAVVVAVKQREADMDGRISTASGDLRQIPPRAIEEARLRRDVTIAENLYTTLQARYEEARLAEASSIPDLQILDQAVTPERPSTNTTPQVILGALFASLGLAILGAIVRDRLDPRFRYPEQVSMGLGLPILGSIPRARSGVHATAEDAAAVVEGLRGIRLSLSHAYGAAGPYLFTVTSPGPGDGKSFVASNLALAFADAGYSTLLIDGDLRRGTLHRVLQAHRRPGLTDYLDGGAQLDEIVQTTSHASLRFIGCGTWMQKAPELLGSTATSRLLGSLRSNYSVIVVDSPPLGVGIDPLVWATATGNMIMVLRTGVTDREMAAAKLDLLERMPIRILGAVLNDVQTSGVYRYYGYTPGYYVTDEKDSLEDKQQIGTGKPA